ncbi:aminotransferase class V-fold PLP-dependent enzyme [Virgibacillus halodenitrificans]|uniref:aminotransferase class V-fold PLP-dependent enzyme n=1 Tax=Virgibacillus halodenitrificans TaxID=1482 RepID=UPI001FB2E9D7|nr:aminotransferase class V-fold PLP-dependent enzyme [Virgibacillus halodenitrificans]MCJ0929777.1 aminotransferase class V-fold PLP-dependent enzyme [Virgibacillus halodenitrificans]
MVYFNYASLGMPDKEAIKQLNDFLITFPREVSESTEDFTMKMVSVVERTRAVIAKAYRVPSKNIAFIANTTEGLGLIANALKNSTVPVKVVVPDIEFISSAFVWKNNSDAICYCQSENGVISPELIHQMMEKNTNILCLSSVQEVSGHRFSFQKLLELREKDPDEYWIVDGIQEAGILWKDIKNDQIDAYIVGGHKWLNSPFGLGFMYISDRLLDRINPSFYGYFNIKEPTSGWMEYLESRNRTLRDLKHLAVKQDASIFESGGMVNVNGAFMLAKSFEAWQSMGLVESFKHISKLQTVFRSNMRNEQFKILGEVNPYTWSSIITLSGKKGIEDEKKLLERMMKAGYRASLRSIEGIGGVRIGFHYSTTFEEVECLVKLINKEQR